MALFVAAIGGESRVEDFPARKRKRLSSLKASS
jgi:hypothetical protein